METVKKHSGTEQNILGDKLSSLTRLSDKDFQRLGEIISSECGIKMPDTKKIMLEARLRKRLRALGIESYCKYCDYLFSREGMENELSHMIDVVTTNKTDFFREKVHFDYLVTNAVPELLSRYRTGIKKKLLVWSAGCSTGEEPYTIAMVLNEIKGYQHNFQFEVVATDISNKVLQKAARGIYSEDRVSTVPKELIKKYFMRSKDREKRIVRIVPELREVVKFRRLNFLNEDFGFKEMPDIIFCRNVFIYFSRSTQKSLLRRFYDHLTPGGYLFMGHCETLSQMRVPFMSLGSMVYKKLQ
jgi:chemotaxis protein methyltransferase CheR